MAAETPRLLPIKDVPYWQNPMWKGFMLGSGLGIASGEAVAQLESMTMSHQEVKSHTSAVERGITTSDIVQDFTVAPLVLLGSFVGAYKTRRRYLERLNAQTQTGSETMQPVVIAASSLLPKVEMPINITPVLNA